MELLPWEVWWEDLADTDFLREEDAADHPLRIRMCQEAAKVGGTVLDVGSCTSIDYPRLTGLGLNYIGVEPIPKFIARAKELYPGIDVRQGRCWNLSMFGNREIDVVYCKGVLQHLPGGTYPEALKEMWRVTDKLLLVSVNRTFLTGNKPDIIFRDPGGPFVNHYNLKAFTKQIRHLGNCAWKTVKGFVKGEEYKDATAKGLIHTLFIIYKMDYLESLK